jgi:hypothetical protein
LTGAAPAAPTGRPAVNADNNELLSLLSQILPSIPLLLVWLGAGVYALVSWRRHPMVSLLTLTAVLMLATITLLGTLSTWYLLRNRVDLSASEVGLRLAIFGIARTCLAALAYVLLFVALFGWRKSSMRPMPYPPDEPLLEDRPADDRFRR